MTYEELKKVNSDNPPKELLEKALAECEGSITFYKLMLEEDKKPYWKGKIGYQAKQKKEIEKRIKQYYG